MRRTSTSVLLIFSATLFILFVFFFIFRDSTPPVVTISPETQYISPLLKMTVSMADDESIIKSLEITAKKDGRSFVIANTTFTDNEKEKKIVFTLNDTGFKDGKVEVEVIVKDNSFGGFGLGNKSVITKTYIIDTTPPRVQIKTSTPYVKKGGSAVIVYSANKELHSTGVMVGEFFFPGYKQKNNDFLCFFAFPYNLTPKEYKPVLIAKDSAGNTYEAAVDVYRLDQQFKNDTLNISQGFLDEKAAEFEAIVPGTMADIERFQKVNGPVRAACAIELLEIGKKSSSVMLWSGAFLRLPRAATRAGFADHRIYLWNGEKIDEQTHLGFDLASIARSPIPASNDGKVIYAGYLGIYGNMVIIDHGVGLQSLYSHLSEIQTTPGTLIKKGDIIGLTGKSGMAGGDHLHFGILISGLEVSPLEWLDSKWIKDNVTSRLEAAGVTK